MPTFPYKGYDLEVDHDPSAEEFAQMSAHIDSLPPKGEQEALKQKNKDMGNSLLSGAGGTLAAIGDIAAGIPKIGARTALAIGGKLADPSMSLQNTWETAGQAVEETFPSFGKGLENNIGYTSAMKPFELYGKGAEYVAEKGSFGNPDVQGALNIGANFLPIPFAGRVGRGLGKVAEAVDPGLRNVTPPKVSEAPVGGAKGLAAELAAPEPSAPLKGQGELFASETEGLASPYDAGQAGVTEPITPQRARAQMELGLRNDLPETMLGDERGVITPELPNEAMQLAKERAGRAEVVPEGPAPVQADLFAPETNVHRAYTDIRAATEAGGERPLTRTEFEQVHQNLAKEPVTAHEMPLDMDTAYQKYLEQVSGKQADMFDIGSRQEAFGQQAFKEQVARQLEEHPFVKNAEKALAKQEKFVSDLKEQVAAGTTRATALVTEIKALEKAQEKVAKVRENVETALTNKQKPSPFKGRGGKQAGAIDPSVFLGKFPEFADSIVKDAMGKLKVMYHGTSKDKAFGDIKAGPTGAWLTDDPIGASEYAKQNDSQNLKYNPDTRRYDELNTASRVMPVYANIKKPYVPTPEEMQVLRRASNYRKEQKVLTDRARAQGYDGIDWGGGVYTALDGSQLKSAFSPEFNTRTRKQGGGVKIDWKDNNKLDVIKEIPAFAESMKLVGHAQIKSPEEAVALAKTAPDVSQNIAQRTVNAFTKGGTYLKAKVNNPVVHYTVDRFLDADDFGKAAISEKLHGEYLGTLRELSKEEYVDAYSLLNAADLSQKTITPEMMQKHGLSPALQQFITTHQNIMADALKQVNRTRDALGKKPIEAREAYSSMNMTGDFRKAAYKVVKDAEGNVKLDEKGQPVKEVVGVIGANSKTLGKNSLASLEEKMTAADPEITFGPLQDLSLHKDRVKGTPHNEFMQALKTLGEDNPAFKDFLDVLSEVSKRDAAEYLGMKKHTLHKKGVWGMEGRKPWLDAADNAKGFFENQVQYIEGAYQWGELATAAKDVNAVLRDENVVLKHGNAIALSEKYMTNAMGLNPSRFGRAVDEGFNAVFGAVGLGPTIPKNVIAASRQVANTFMLSMNVPFLAINLLQPILATPGMVSFLGSRGMDTGASFKGAVKAMEALVQLRDGKPLSELNFLAEQYAKKHHVYATDMVEHTNQTRKGVGYYANKITQSPAAYIETGTRAVMYWSLVHIMHEGGLTPKSGLFEQAHRMTSNAMNNYGAMEKPAIYNALGPLGSAAYNLKSYSHNEMGRLAEYAREIPNNHNGKPLLLQLASTIVFAGVLGLPFMAQWTAIYDTITEKLGSPRSLTLDVISMSEQLAKNLGEKGQYVLSHGIFAAAGVDASTRIGQANLLPHTPSDVAFAGTSKLGQMASGVGSFVKKPSEETAKSLAYQLSPNILQGPEDLAWFSKGDMAYSKDPSDLKPVARRNATDKLVRSIGFTGINESVQKQKAYQNQQLDMARMEIRKAAMNTLTQDMFRNRPMLQKTLDKYFINGEGDPQTFATEIEKKAIGLSLTPSELALLRSAASNSITKARSLQRRMQ